MSYHHYTIDERESILIYRTQGLNFSQIAKLLHRHPSSISREWKRHLKEGSYSPSHAQESYHRAKSHCGRKRMLEIDHNLSNTVKHLFLDYQWSPEEIEGRLRLEYGKTRHTKGYVENRGKISISHTIHEKPEDANNRTRIGDWEADTVAGKTGKACLVTLTDRYSRFLKIKKVAVKKSKLVIEAMVKLLEPLTKYTVTPDRGKEFTYHQKLSDQLNIEVYFPDPHAPWQRGTNENTNGLFREYFPKGSDLTLVNDQTIQLWENKLNNRSRKCLNWKTPYEVFYGKVCIGHNKKSID